MHQPNPGNLRRRGKVCYETGFLHEISDFSKVLLAPGGFFMLRNRQVPGCFVTFFQTGLKMVFKRVYNHKNDAFMLQEQAAFLALTASDF